MAENDITSKEWCDLIFQGKNQEYGAYQLRVESFKRHNWALLIVFLVIFLGIFIHFIFVSATQKPVIEEVQITELSQLSAPVVIEEPKIKSNPEGMKKKGPIPFERTPTQRSAPRITADPAEVGGTLKKVEGNSGKIKVVSDNSVSSDAEVQVASAAASRRVAGAFGKGSALRTSGNGGTGDKSDGSPQGNSDTGKKAGIGGNGTFDLDGRSLGPGGLPSPSYNVREEGKVVVTIVVNPSGRVISTSINKMTNTVNSALRKAAEDAAKRARFNSVGSSNNQSGTITYYFKFK